MPRCTHGKLTSFVSTWREKDFDSEVQCGNKWSKCRLSPFPVLIVTWYNKKCRYTQITLAVQQYVMGCYSKKNTQELPDKHSETFGCPKGIPCRSNQPTWNDSLEWLSLDGLLWLKQCLIRFHGSKNMLMNTRTLGSLFEHCDAAVINVIDFICWHVADQGEHRYTLVCEIKNP